MLGTTSAFPTYFTKLSCVYPSLAGAGAMPLAVAQYFRHLAVRCSRISRDCTDEATSKELVLISVELVEKAEKVEAAFKIEASSDDDAA